MTAEEYKRNMYRGNSYTCGFCKKITVGKPTLTLCLCKGLAGRDIADICEECLQKIEEKVVL